MLSKLVTSQKDENIKMSVITLFDNNYFLDEIEKTDSRVYCVNLKKNVLAPLKLFTIMRIIMKEKPTVLQTWMYHCDFLGVVVKLLFPKLKLVWNIRHSELIKGVDKSTTILLAKILARLSSIPDKVIYGSHAALVTHKKIGYRNKNNEIISNGFNTMDYAPDHSIRSRIRSFLDITNETVVLGTVGRASKVKNQLMLIEVFDDINKIHPNTKLILIGKGIRDQYLSHKIVLENQNIILIDETNKINDYLKAFDLFILPSLSEGFPNVLGEAMSTEVPCIATDVGDSALIIGNDNFVAKKNSKEDLQERISYWYRLNEKEKSELKKHSRNRIKNNYSLDITVNSYVKAYNEL